MTKVCVLEIAAYHSVGNNVVYNWGVTPSFNRPPTEAKVVRQQFNGHLHLLLNRRGLQLGTTVEHQLQPALRGRTGAE